MQSTGLLYMFLLVLKPYKETVFYSAGKLCKLTDHVFLCHINFWRAFSRSSKWVQSDWDCDTDLTINPEMSVAFSHSEHEGKTIIWHPGRSRLYLSYSSNLQISMRNNWAVDLWRIETKLWPTGFNPCTYLTVTSRTFQILELRGNSSGVQ